ncbi:MAG: phenylalanine--tRNA ligase subunit beta, partial [Lachnospiraceae bacterium]|nr:phenylalanine--tRNA ligase subunit beta [Lachnospiraceae bacterium]
MNTSLSWIKAYVPELNCTAQEYTDAMTLSGTKVEGYTEYDKNLEKIVVGKINSIEKHPDADKLIICQVDIGTGEELQIVTGAPNVHVGDLVPVVLDGGKVAGGHDGGPLPEDGIKIKKGKLRGIESFGMMCSIEELGSSKELYPEAPDNGIYIFEAGSVKPGDDAIEALGLHDAVIEYEITSNRVDCYSVIGIAREAAATFRLGFKPPVVTETGNDEDVNDYVKVTVKDTDLCPRYVARVVKNIKLAPSPLWLRRRLASNGIRPINNIVDITNYVMEEYGQPMHAFDLDTVSGRHIIVKRAEEGEKFVTLDGQERTMDGNTLMICDADKAIGIAGIMGGQNSMITDDVKTMMFESACFDGTNIRLSGKKLGMHTDAQGKFEKGLDPNNALEAINRACQLVEELGAGEVVGGTIDIYPDPVAEKQIAFDPKRANDLLGTDISVEEIKTYFDRLELGYDTETNIVTVPTFRQDLLLNADLAEEVARFYGYDKIPMTLPTGEATVGKLSFKLRVEQQARQVAEFCGFSESMTYSFESPKVFDKLLLGPNDPARQAIRIMNPLGEDYSVMRTLPVNGMLTSLANNYNMRNKAAKLYELATVYIPKELPLKEYPDERVCLTFGAYGGDTDFYTMKGVVEELFEKLGLKKRISYDPNAGKIYMHPGRQALINYAGETVGYLG